MVKKLQQNFVHIIVQNFRFSINACISIKYVFHNLCRILAGNETAEYDKHTPFVNIVSRAKNGN